MKKTTDRNNLIAVNTPLMELINSCADDVYSSDTLWVAAFWSKHFSQCVKDHQSRSEVNIWSNKTSFPKNTSYYRSVYLNFLMIVVANTKFYCNDVRDFEL